MSDNRETAASVLVRPDLDELLEQTTAGKPPELEPVGQCPYCHHDLEKREVQQQRDFRRVTIGERASSVVLLTFWACTNEECCLMFWRHPRIFRWVPPLADDLLEH